ncbi:phage tail tape measure protein [Streptomyces sp. B21-102]|uniref:phage tail tape measure protein n=1 Tax=Streptomyces sp. B21-102 TaxID=3039416 RepID=UPI002FF01A9F
MATSTIVYALVGRDRASATFRQVGRSANRLASTSSKVGAAIKTSLAVGAVAVVGIGAASIKAAGDFEKNMNRVAALSGATGKELTKLRDQAKDLGRTTQYGATQSADAMAQLATAGLTVNQILGSMPSVLALASSEQLDLTRAAEITTNVLTGYGMSIKQIPHAVDAMVKASVKANTSVDDLGEAFKYSGPIAHQAGLQFEEAVAATALMGNAGIKASMAGTALRGAVTRLLSPTDKVTDTLKKLGVNVSTADGKLRPLTSIVDQLAKKGATTGDIMTIFGQRAGPGMAALIQQGSAKLAAMTKELEHSGGTAEKIAKIQMKGWRGEIIRLKNAWEGLMIEVGDTGLLTGATKALSGVTLGVRNLAGWVNDEGIPKVKAFSSTVAGMIPVAAIQQRVGQAKAVVTDFWSGLTKSKPARAAKDLMSGLDLYPHAGFGKTAPAPKAVKDVQPGQGDLYPHAGFGKTAAKVKPPKSLATTIGEQVRSAFTDGISSVKWDKIGSTIGSGLATGLEKLAKSSIKLTAAFGKLLAGIDWVGIGISLGKFVPSLLLGFIVGLLNFDMVGMLKGLASHWQDVLLAVLFVAFLPAKWAGAIGKALGKIPFLGKLLKWAFEIFTKFSKQIVGWAGKLLAGFGRGFLAGLKVVFPGLGRLLTEGVGKLAVGILAYSGRFIGFGERVIKGLGTGIIKGAEGLGTAAARIIGPILKPFVRAGSWLLSRGIAVVKGFSSGIVTGAKAVGGFAKTWIIDPVVGVFKTAGSWLWARGAAVVSGFKSGIVTGAKAVGRFGKTWIIDPVVGAFKGAGTWLWARGSALVSGFKSGVVAGAKGIGGWILRNVVSPSVSVFLKAGSWLVSKGSALISGLKSGIVAGIKGIGGWIKSNIIDPVVSAVKSFFGIHSPSTVFAEIGGYLVSGLFKGLASTSGTAIAKKIFGDMPSALGSIVQKGIVSVASLPGKAMKALGSLGSKLGGFFKGLVGGGGGGSVGKGVSQWTSQVAQVLSMLGVPATAIGPVLQRIQMESGGNPNAINLWDSNAKAGHPSQGLMQTIPGTFAAYAGPFRGRGITDPLANIYAGVNYAMHRYGAGWLSVMTRPGGYAKGTGSGLAPIGQTAWVGEKGAELMQVTPKGTRILSHKDSMAYAKTNGLKLPGYASGTAKSRKTGHISAEARSRKTARIAVENSINNGFRKTLTTGTAAAIVSAVKAMITKLQKAGLGKAFTDKVIKQSDRMQALAAKKASVGSRINQAKAFAADQASTITDYLSISGTSAPSVTALISQMTGQQKTVTDLVKLTASLKARGASSGLLAQLGAAGPGSQLAAILGSRSVKSQDIKKLNGLVASGTKLASSFGNAMADAMYDSGSQAAKGFLAGLKAQQAGLEAQMGKLADALLKSIKSKLKIKSPSRVFRDQVGRQVALGTAAGIDAHVPSVVSSAQRMADSVAGVSTSRVVIPGPAGSGAAQQVAAVQELAAAIQAGGGSGDGQFVGELRLDSGELLGMIRGTVRPMIKESEKQQAYRGKVGLRR